MQLKLVKNNINKKKKYDKIVSKRQMRWKYKIRVNVHDDLSLLLLKGN